MSLNINKMMKQSKKKGPKFEEGTYPALPVQIIDLGQQEITDLKTGEVKGHAPHVMITFEFPTETIEIEKDGETKDMPRWLSRKMLVSGSDRSNFYKYLKAVDPKGDTESMEDHLGRNVLAEVGTTSGGNPKITAILPPMKGMKYELVNDPVVFDLDKPDLDVWDKLLDWIKDDIKNGKDFENTKLAQELREREARQNDDGSDDDADDNPLNFDDLEDSFDE